MIVSVFLILIVSICDLTNPLLVRKLISIIKTGGIEESKFQTVNLIALLIVGVYILRGTLNGIRHYMVHIVGYGVLSDVRIRVYDHLQKLSLKFYHERQTGEIMSKITTDIAMIESFIAHVLTQLLLDVLVVSGVVIIMLYLNWRLALVSLMPIPILFFLVRSFAKRVEKVYKKVYKKLADISSILQDNISGIGVIQSFTQEDHEKEKFRRESSGHYNIVMKAIGILSIHSPVMEIMGSIGTVFVVWYGGTQVLKAGLKIEDLIAFLFYMGFFYRPILNVAHIADSIQHTRAGTERIFNILDTEPDVKDKKGAFTPDKIEGILGFHDVFFEYESGIPVLKNISFRIKKGKTVALVGPSGAGKTTIAKLIPRFYDPKNGSISLGGHDIKNLKLKFLRNQISMVLQDVFLFHGTVRENILYGKLKASEEEMVEAAKAAHAHSFILDLPERYDTVVGERGVKLSGGQKQRISIARAILKDAPVLVLDEATSSVDTETEGFIKVALSNLMKDRTTLVIAHRLSTVQNADLIVVLDRGEIVQAGCHDELLKAGGLYKRLYEIQFAVQE
jgi:ATP-binding cassette subfamily B protein/subfamily B ATP-binding cassette protein MsbA